MRKLPIEYSDIYKEFMKGKFVVKTQTGNFNGVSRYETRTNNSKVKKVCCWHY